jgi:hypothetical protein
MHADRGSSASALPQYANHERRLTPAFRFDDIARPIRTNADLRVGVLFLRSSLIPTAARTICAMQ